MANTVTVEPTQLKSPFQLFTAFSEQDRSKFFGRDKEIKELYNLLQETNVVVVQGVSGTGKTSLVQCGLVNETKHFNWTCIMARRFTDISASLLTELKKHVDAEYIKEENPAPTILIKEVYLKTFQPILLVFDQFEEVLINGLDAERQAFAGHVRNILAMRIPIKIIFVIKEEFSVRMEAFEKSIPGLLAKKIWIRLMDKTGCREVIIKSCALFNIGLFPIRQKESREIDTPEAACNIISDEGGLVHLPYLQIFLDRLWKEAVLSNPEHIVIDKELVAKVGRIGDILKLFLEEKIKEQHFVDKADGWKILQLFVPEEGNSREKVDIAAYTSIPKANLEAFIAYLVDNRMVSNCGGTVFELSHESLVPVIQQVNISELRARIEVPTIFGNPYKGLYSFDVTDANRFYGRRTAIASVYEKTRANNFIVVAGNSGSGKSSLIKAGLFPKLQADGYELLQTIKAGEDALAQLNSITIVLENSIPGRKYILLIDQCEELITRVNKEDRQAILNKIDLLVQHQNNNPITYELKIIVTVRADFEQQLSVIPPISAEWKKGKYIIPPFSRDEIIEVIEEPAYQAGFEFSPPSLVETIADEVYVSQATGLLPLMSFTLSELYDKYIESGREDNLLSEADYQSFGGVIGGLQNRADLLYKNFEREYPNRFTLYQQLMKNIVLRMVYLSTGELASQRVPAEDLVFVDKEVNMARAEVMNQLTGSRLVVAAADSEHQQYYEPAHDVFIKTWGKIWEWIDQTGKDFMSLRVKLNDAANEYFEKRESPELLWTNASWLNDVGEARKLDRYWMNKRETLFIDHSVEAKRQLTEKEQRQLQEKQHLKDALARQEIELNEARISRLQRSSIFLVAALLLVSLFGFYAYKNYSSEKNINAENHNLNNRLKQNIEKQKEANNEARIAQKKASDSSASAQEQRALAEKALLKLDTQLTVTNRAVALAKSRGDSLQTQNRLLATETKKVESVNDQLSTTNDRLKRTLRDLQEQRIQNTAQSVSLVKSFENKDDVKAFRIIEEINKRDSSQEVKSLYNKLAFTAQYFYSNHAEANYSSYSPDGHYILLLSTANNTVQVRKSSSFQLIDSLPSTEKILSASFSPDSKSLMLVYTGHIDLCQADSLQHKVFFIKLNGITAARFSNDPANYRLLAVTDHRIYLFSPGKALESPDINIPKEIISSAVFSNDDKKIISVTLSGNINIWDARTLKLLESNNGNELAFLSPAGHYFVTASSKKAVLYKTSNGDIITLDKTYGVLNSVVFSKDDQKAVMVFSSLSAREHQQLQQQKTDNYYTVTVLLVDLQNMHASPINLNDFLGVGNLLSLMNGSLRLAVDHNTVLFGGANGLVKLLNLNNPQQYYNLTGHQSAVNTLSVNVDGSILTSDLSGDTKTWKYGTPLALSLQGVLPKMTTAEMSLLGIYYEAEKAGLK